MKFFSSKSISKKVRRIEIFRIASAEKTLSYNRRNSSGNTCLPCASIKSNEMYLETRFGHNTCQNTISLWLRAVLEITDNPLCPAINGSIGVQLIHDLVVDKRILKRIEG